MRRFMILASLGGGAAAFIGFWTAYPFDLPVGPTDVVLLGVIYTAAWAISMFFSKSSRQPCNY